mmetsp:Transcript_15839/g.34282  ORF Transcript_15839/g.34282 Transcript_15839/m.34282 type:complete len:228 (-) Transcript_15839:53-736(-)
MRAPLVLAAWRNKPGNHGTRTEGGTSPHHTIALCCAAIALHCFADFRDSIFWCCLFACLQCGRKRKKRIKTAAKKHRWRAFYCPCVLVATTTTTNTNRATTTATTNSSSTNSGSSNSVIIRNNRERKSGTWSGLISCLPAPPGNKRFKESFNVSFSANATVARRNNLVAGVDDIVFLVFLGWRCLLLLAWGCSCLLERCSRGARELVCCLRFLAVCSLEEHARNSIL